MNSEQQPDAPLSVEERRARARERSEAKNQAVRDTLEPLEPGERPLAVTISAVVAGLLTIGNALAYFLNNDAVKPEDQSKAAVQTVVICLLLATAAIGMWRVRYWAVLGFQAILGITVIICVLLLTRATTVLAALGVLAISIGSGVLFWYLIRAMARIQMPEAPELEHLREMRAEAEAKAAAAAEESAGEDKEDG